MTTPRESIEQAARDWAVAYHDGKQWRVVPSADIAPRDLMVILTSDTAGDCAHGAAAEFPGESRDGVPGEGRDQRAEDAQAR